MTCGVVMGCASGTASSGSAPTSGALVSDKQVGVRGGLLLFTEPGIDERMIDAPVDLVWAALPEVYSELEIPIGVSDPVAREYGNSSYRTRRVGGERLSRFLECGHGMTAQPYADQYDVSIMVVTKVRPADDSATTVLTTVDAYAKARATSGNAIHCGSKGTLELRIAQMIVDALGLGVVADTAVEAGP